MAAEEVVSVEAAAAGVATENQSQNLAELQKLDRTYGHSCLKAMMGSTLAAFAAGYKPKIIPTPTLINRGSNMLSRVITVGILAKYVIIEGMIIPTARPTIPPRVESTTVSIRN